MSLKSFYLDNPPLLSKKDIKPTVILLLAALLPTLHRYVGSTEFYINVSSSVLSLGDNVEWFAVNYFFLSAFILMGVVPFFLIKFYLKENSADFGLQIGDWQNGLKTVAVLFPIIAIALLLPAAYQKEFKDFYPLYKGAENSFSSFFGFEFSRGILYYSAWEFFFRGFLLFGMRKYVGDWNAILIQTIPSCLWHIGYPAGEILMSIPGGILFGVMAIRTRSIIWPFILHWLIGIAMDAFIVLTK